MAKYKNPEIAKIKFRKFKIISEICSLDELITEKELNSNFSDFEDSLQYFSAVIYDYDILNTRNGKDFKESQILVMTADEYLKRIKNKKFIILILLIY